MEKDKDAHIVTLTETSTSNDNIVTAANETDEPPPTSEAVLKEDNLHVLEEIIVAATASTSDGQPAAVTAALEQTDDLDDDSISNVGQSADLPQSIVSSDESSFSSLPSLNSIVCRICHNAENPEKLVSPCNCRGTLAFVHIYCLERWITTSRCTTCELCHFEYHTEQTLRYTCLQSLRIYYSRHMSRRTLQEDCQMFSMLTLVAFGIVGTLLVGLQYYLLQGNIWGIGKLWTKGWLLFFLFTTLAVYVVNIYLLAKSQLVPWFRWWQSTRDIRLVLENRSPHLLQHIQHLQKCQAQQLTAAIAVETAVDMPGSSPQEDIQTDATRALTIILPHPGQRMYNLKEVARRLYLELDDD